ncbi:MAG: universal stress protein [Calothrix sp. SM1_5_4]|nr:universal stress protein [Calothrix sp. SM1_5_4]
MYRPAFNAAVGMARSLDARLTLLYKEPFVDGMFMSPEIYDYIARETSDRKNVADEWLRASLEKGVGADLIFDSEPGNVVDAIISRSHERKSDLILMVSQSDPVSAWIVGSVTRQVIRRADCAVWSVHV